jgi:hypothetical protein
MGNARHSHARQPVLRALAAGWVPTAVRLCSNRPSVSDQHHSVNAGLLRRRGAHRGLGSPLRICTGTGLAPIASAPGLGSPFHICTGTGLASSHICTGTGPATLPRMTRLAEHCDTVIDSIHVIVPSCVSGIFIAAADEYTLLAATIVPWAGAGRARCGGARRPPVLHHGV